VTWALAAFLTLCVCGGFEYGRLPEVGDLDRRNPTTTALMEERTEEAREHGQKQKRRQQWVALDRISPVAVDAVLISEDARFYQHSGVDLAEAKAALEEAWDEKRLGRGASTITQQLAKNLWLSGDRSPPST
jgi:monofunctional glycosyltransferase